MGFGDVCLDGLLKHCINRALTSGGPTDENKLFEVVGIRYIQLARPYDDDIIWQEWVCVTLKIVSWCISWGLLDCLKFKTVNKYNMCFGIRTLAAAMCHSQGHAEVYKFPDSGKGLPSHSIHRCVGSHSRGKPRWVWHDGCRSVKRSCDVPAVHESYSPQSWSIKVLPLV